MCVTVAIFLKTREKATNSKIAAKSIYQLAAKWWWNTGRNARWIVRSDRASWSARRRHRPRRQALERSSYVQTGRRKTRARRKSRFRLIAGELDSFTSSRSKGTWRKNLSRYCKAWRVRNEAFATRLRAQGQNRHRVVQAREGSAQGRFRVLFGVLRGVERGGSGHREGMGSEGENGHWHHLQETEWHDDGRGEHFEALPHWRAWDSIGELDSKGSSLPADHENYKNKYHTAIYHVGIDVLLWLFFNYCFGPTVLIISWSCQFWYYLINIRFP